MLLLRQAWITGEVKMTMGVECVLQGMRTNPLLGWFSLVEHYMTLSVSHSVTAFCKIGTFYGSMASLAAINYSFGGLASLQETQYLPITRGCSAVLLLNG